VADRGRQASDRPSSTGVAQEIEPFHSHLENAESGQPKARPKRKRKVRCRLSRKRAGPSKFQECCFAWSGTPPRDTAWAMSEENVELARKAIDALNRGDLDAWLAFLSPDVVWEALPGVPGLGELYRGRAEVREWIEQLFELAEGGIHTEIEQLTDLGDDRVFLAIVLTARGRGSGVPFEMPNWEVIWFAEGLVTRRQIFWTRDEALEAAGLSE
jgi:ketosteroid isomerase-like protein